MYTYEFEMWRGENEWCVAPLTLPGATQGVDVEDACESAADLLREIVRDYLIKGEIPPAPTFDNTLEHDGMRIVVSVDASLDDVDKVCATEAARMLNVVPSRITAMIDSGLLDGWRDGRNTWVTKSSVKERLASQRKAGRPKKTARHVAPL